jgi:hypothetical protein
LKGWDFEWTQGEPTHDDDIVAYRLASPAPAVASCEATPYEEQAIRRFQETGTTARLARDMTVLERYTLDIYCHRKTNMAPQYARGEAIAEARALLAALKEADRGD